MKTGYNNMLYNFSMKKALYLGTFIVTSIPIISVVSCGSNNSGSASKFLKVNGTSMNIEKLEDIEKAMSSYEGFLALWDTIKNFVLNNYGTRIVATIDQYFRISIETNSMTVDTLADPKSWSNNDYRNISEFYIHFFFNFLNSNKGRDVSIESQSSEFVFKNKVSTISISVPVGGFEDEVEMQKFLSNTDINVDHLYGVNQ